ncbi:MAG TPA: hypothetical protein VNZ45_00665 [Bacteroidia bacterium]|jgi:hypothetical protein|nr:hypothetical protein [Bacteroidia bacterium]
MENATQPTQAPAPAGGAWKVLGILSVVLGGLSILFSFIPCLGMYALYSGGFATILSIIALMMANKAKAPMTLAIIGLVISLLSAGIGYWQRTKLEQLGGELKKVGDSLKININTMNDSIKKAVKDINDTTKK